jgi:hypothetical protein
VSDLGVWVILIDAGKKKSKGESICMDLEGAIKKIRCDEPRSRAQFVESCGFDWDRGHRSGNGMYKSQIPGIWQNMLSL